jgi:hypothetical protein
MGMDGAPKTALEEGFWVDVPRPRILLGRQSLIIAQAAFASVVSQPGIPLSSILGMSVASAEPPNLDKFGSSPSEILGPRPSHVLTDAFFTFAPENR